MYLDDSCVAEVWLFTQCTAGRLSNYLIIFKLFRLFCSACRVKNWIRRHTLNITVSCDSNHFQCESFWAGKWRAMGCGGSRTDALEPRYLESWTKETESTWLTSTDTDIPLSSIQSIPSENSEAGFTSEKTISPGKKNELLYGWADGWMNTELIS